MNILYSLSRRFLPSVRERYRLETMIGPIGYWEEIQTYHFEFLKRVGLKAQHRLLDIGCGPLPAGLVLIPYLDHRNYVGIDICEEAVNEAYNQISKNRLASKNPVLLVSKSFGRNELGCFEFDYIWVSQVLYHLDKTEVRDLLQQVARCLAPGGVCYADIIGYPNNVTTNSAWSGFSFHLHEFHFLEMISAKLGLTMTQLGRIDEYGYPVDLGLRSNIMLQFRHGRA